MSRSLTAPLPKRGKSDRSWKTKPFVTDQMHNLPGEFRPLWQASSSAEFLEVLEAILTSSTFKKTVNSEVIIGIVHLASYLRDKGNFTREDAVNFIPHLNEARNQVTSRRDYIIDLKNEFLEALGLR